MNKHTPGPWTFSVLRWPNGEFHGEPYIYAPKAREHPSEGRHVATLCKLDEVDANARLIAAAPELLEACKALLHNVAEPISTDPWAIERRAAHEQARKAIAKAQGGEC